MIIRFADEFKIELRNAPEAIVRCLMDEIGEHIVADDVGQKCDMIIEFRHSIDFEGKVKYIIEQFTVGFNREHFYLLDKDNNKMEVKDFKNKKIIDCEDKFNPEDFSEILEYFYMRKILESNKMFLHASGMTVGGKTIIFPAYANTGKTKILVKMMRRYNGNFIGDDWIIIDNNGNAYPYYKRLYIGLELILENRDFFKDYPVILPPAPGHRLNTVLGFSKRLYKHVLYVIKTAVPIRLPTKYRLLPPIKMKASEIRKDTIVDPTKLNKIDYVVFVSRCSSEKIDHEPVDAVALTEAVMWSMLFEDTIKPDFENWAVFTGHSDPASRDKRIEKMRAIMRCCFQKTNNLWLEIPIKVPSEEVANYIVSKILESKIPK